ncbi:hypothetical protein MKW92_040738 [Papaver armeniacum]|nr:hypothetical protein MKW92_040738 [Papaver armeniacum]
MTIVQLRKLGLPLMNLVRFKGIPILEQLQLEEKLLRTSSETGVSSMMELILQQLSWECLGKFLLLPLIFNSYIIAFLLLKGLQGGGTVIVDQGTIFVTFICNRIDVPGVQPYPQPIMSWSGLLYDEVFQEIGYFHLRENDYVFGNCKFGGNAQSITKNRWIHHTSFLWDYETKNMAYLKQPRRIPKYRSERNHLEFICRMKEYMPRSAFIEKTLSSVGSRFLVEPTNLEAIGAHSGTAFAHSTSLLTKQELEAALGSQPLNLPLEVLES